MKIGPTQFVGYSDSVASRFIKRIRAFYFARGAVAPEIAEDVSEAIRCQIGKGGIPARMVAESIVEDEDA
jgi:hypothetical protein